MLQSLYTSAVIDQIIHDRTAAAARARQTPSRRRRLFGRGRDVAPHSSPTARLRVSASSAREFLAPRVRVYCEV